MTRFLPTATTLTAAVFSIGVFAAPAMADTLVTEPVTMTYDTTALNENGAVELVLQDLQRQAHIACMSIRPLLNTETVDEACVTDVMEQAVEAIDSPILTAAFQQNDGYNDLALNLYAES